LNKLVVLLAAISASSIATGATVDVDGTQIKTLSAAITQAQEADDGPHVINIKVDALPTPDGGIVVTEPVTVNGDADGNGEKCDILANIEALQATEDQEGLLGKAFIKLYSAGNVVINDIKIHPNADGTKVTDSELVDGIRVFCPKSGKDVGNYVLNRVWISGSDGNNGDKYVPLDTADDLYAKPGIKMWSRQNTMGNRGVIHCANRKRAKGDGERGEYNLTLNDCHVGLGRGVAMNFTANSGKHEINGGIYGHCGVSAIRISGNVISLTGSKDNRLRLVRGNNFPAKGDNQLIAYTPKAQVDKIEFVDLMPKPDIKTEIETVIPNSLAATRKDIRLITDPSDMAVVLKGGDLPEVAPFKGWLTAEAAWAEAQKSKHNMVLVFYSPGVEMAENLCKLMETNRSARSYLSNCCTGRVDVSSVEGQKIAQKYGIYKIPALLRVASDAKSYQKFMPDSVDDWNAIETELAK